MKQHYAITRVFCGRGASSYIGTEIATDAVSALVLALSASDDADEIRNITTRRHGSAACLHTNGSVTVATIAD